MGFAKFVQRESFSVKSYFKRPETEVDFALELEKAQGSKAEAGVQGGQKWWVSPVMTSLVTPTRAEPPLCSWHFGPFLGYPE